MARIPKKTESIHKIEKTEPVKEVEGEVVETATGLKMSAEDKLFSMTNAVKILPPNLIVDGRHSRENIQAICGFIVTEDMMNTVYKDFRHDED